MQELFECIVNNRKYIYSYFEAVQYEIDQYSNSTDPNAHLRLDPDHSKAPHPRQCHTYYMPIERIRAKIDEINKKINSLKGDNGQALPASHQNNIKILHADKQTLEEMAEDLEQQRLAAIQQARELLEALKNSPPLIMDQDMFTKSSEVPSWYLRALSIKMLPYVSAFIFAIGLAAAVISTGLLINSPAFVVFSLKALNDIVTPLCISGITIGGTAAIIGGTSLVSACLFSNLRGDTGEAINRSELETLTFDL